jgi:hypothetical protein
MRHNKKLLYTFFVVLLAAVILACGTTTTSAASMAGKWLDPDTSGTITTIAKQGSGYTVVSVMNPDRGVNELTETNWSNGVLTWTYCPQDMHCIASKTVSVSSDTLTAEWWWVDDTSAGGTTYFSRQP